MEFTTIYEILGLWTFLVVDDIVIDGVSAESVIVFSEGSVAILLLLLSDD